LLIKYIKSVLWRVAKRLSYIQDARCLKVNSISMVIASGCKIQPTKIYVQLLQNVIIWTRRPATRGY